MKLFYDDEFDAIATAIGNSGHEFKTVAAHMFPDMKPESAYARLKACCNPTGDQRLSFGQTVRLHEWCRAAISAAVAPGGWAPAGRGAPAVAAGDWLHDGGL